MSDNKDIEFFVNSLDLKELCILKKYLTKYDFTRNNFKQLAEEIFLTYQYGLDDKSKFHEFLNRDYVFLYEKFCKLDRKTEIDINYTDLFGMLIMYVKEGHTIYSVKFKNGIIDLDRVSMLKVPKVLILKYEIDGFLKEVK